MHGDLLVWLLTKTEARLTGRTCKSPYGPVTEKGRQPCRRPVWGDGTVDGLFYGFCSRCWHLHNAFDGHYVTMRANPAAALLNDAATRRLTFHDDD